MQLAALLFFWRAISAVQYSVSEGIKIPGTEANTLQHLRNEICTSGKIQCSKNKLAEKKKTAAFNKKTTVSTAAEERNTDYQRYFPAVLFEYVTESHK